MNAYIPDSVEQSKQDSSAKKETNGEDTEEDDDLILARDYVEIDLDVSSHEQQTVGRIFQGD